MPEGTTQPQSGLGISKILLQARDEKSQLAGISRQGGWQNHNQNQVRKERNAGNNKLMSTGAMAVKATKTSTSSKAYQPLSTQAGKADRNYESSAILLF